MSYQQPPAPGYANPAGQGPQGPYVNSSAAYISDRTRQRTVSAAYGHMTLGLVVTFAVAWLTAASGLALRFLMATGAFGWIILAVVQVGLAIALSSRVLTMKMGTAYALFYLFAVTMGFTLSTIFYAYDSTSILVALGLCAGFFLCLTMIGLTTKANLLKGGTIITAGLIFLIVAELVLGFIPGATMMWRIVSGIGIALFAFMTARDAQFTRRMLDRCQSDEMARRVSILAALELYLDFVNLFQYLLSILGTASTDN